MNFRKLLLLVGLFLPLAFSGCATETPAEHAANQYAAAEKAAAPIGGNLPDYSLNAADLEKAHHLEKTGNVLEFVGTVWDIAQMLLLLWLGGIAWMRDKAVSAGKSAEDKGHRKASRWIQGLVFLGLFLAVSFLLDLPLSLYGHHLGLAYGLSVQHWGSWFWDHAKSLIMTWIIGWLLIMLLFWVIRKFPRRWWLVFWGLFIPLTFLGVFASPYVGFLFNTYEPLQKNHAELVAKLEQVVKKGGMTIPPDRMYLMKASEKVTTLNADVEGFGASKRVVVWDNTITKLSDDQVLGVFAHETGHYVLHHLERGVAMSTLGSFVMLWLGYICVQWALRRFGARWRIPDQGDWGTFAVLLLALNLYGVFLQPLPNTLSRAVEHDADVYGQEAIHGIVVNPQDSMQKAFDTLGKVSYSVPNPSLFEEFWLDNHPSLGRRAAFAHAYDPWAVGAEPKYFPKQ
jgi:STE24 endopeptidase